MSVTLGIFAGVSLVLQSQPRDHVFSTPGDAALVAQRDRLFAMVEQSPAPLIVLDPAGRLDAVNRAARRLFRTDGRIIDPPKDLLATLTGTKAPGVLRLALDQSERSYLVNRTEATGTFGHAIVASLVDVEAELRAAESAALRELMQILSHEIMGALTPIASLSRTAADMLGDAQFDRDAARDAVETVASRAEGLEQFTSAYQRLARLPPPNLVAVDVAALLRDSVRLFRSRFDTQGVTLELQMPDNPPMANGDAAQLGIAFWALLQNAAEATLARGDHLQRLVRVSVKIVRDALEVVVEDNGIGIGAGDAAQIFDPFYTTKETGSGIGLSLARQIVRAHGGEIKLQMGRTNGGAAFTLSVPRLP
jgi:signal transduction histidine kinase